MTAVPAGADVVLPWSVLPKATKHLTFRVVTCVKLRDDALSRILDRLPDSGLAGGVLEWK